MGQLSASFTFDLESRMRLVSESEYNRLTSRLWWTQVAKEITINSKKEHVSWMMDTAGIQYTGDRFGNSVQFEDIVLNYTEFTYQSATNGLKLNKNQLLDYDGNGVKLAAQWAREQGAYAAYWPQKNIADVIRKGATAGNNSYDGVTFFNVAHPLNPYDSTIGTYCNWFHGSPSGNNPGALPIDSSVTLDVAVNNLTKAISAIATIPMANGVDPRMLRARGLLVPPALVPRAQQITNAKFIAQAAASGGGAADFSAVVTNWGFDQPIEATELAAAFGGSDTSYYLITEQLSSNELGALVYANRDPFAITYNDGVTDAQLARDNGLQWIIRGENQAAYGHPYLLFRIDAS
jgi:phage major head subunit gpT-like protein